MVKTTRPSERKWTASENFSGCWAQVRQRSRAKRSAHCCAEKGCTKRRVIRELVDGAVAQGARQQAVEGRVNQEGKVEPTEPEAKTIVREGPKVARNDPGPCGSGKNDKKCHGGAEATP